LSYQYNRDQKIPYSIVAALDSKQKLYCR